MNMGGVIRSNTSLHSTDLSIYVIRADMDLPNSATSWTIAKLIILASLSSVQATCILTRYKAYRQPLEILVNSNQLG